MKEWSYMSVRLPVRIGPGWPLPSAEARSMQMKEALSPYVVSFQTEPYHKGTRHHWMICREQKPDELVSWGHAPTRELAESAAEKELQDLNSGLTEGGQVINNVKPFTHRIADGHY